MSAIRGEAYVQLSSHRGGGITQATYVYSFVCLLPQDANEQIAIRDSHFVGASDAHSASALAPSSGGARQTKVRDALRPRLSRRRPGKS